MKKFFTSILLVQVIFCLYLNAQPTDVLRNELDAIFQYVDKSQVPTGYLEEYGPGFVPMRSFNGLLTDSNRFNFDSWQLIYGQIRASKIYSTTALPTLTTAINSIKTAGNHTLNIFAVPLLLMDYSVLNPYAVQQNLFTISNNKIFDVAGRSQSPYQQKLLFGATPAVNYTNNGTVQVLFKPDLFYTNTSKTISTIHIDFNDHSGYMPIALNTPFTKTYTDTGYKRWKIKLTCTDNSVYECYTDFQVTAITATSNVPARYGNNPDILEQPFNAVPGPGPWAHSGGKVTVWYSRKGTERTLNKPFIIVEGYDASDVAPSIKPKLTYKELLELLDLQPKPYDLMSKLDDLAGYDLVFLDFKDGTDNLQRNAALFEQVLGWVNQTKAGNPNPQDNVVLGLSMGGMITRYALANLTKQNISTGTRLLISHDSPHQGANTPLGLQYMTRFLASRGSIGGFILNELDIVREGNELLDKPASAELLIYKATSPTTFTANTFLGTTYRSMVTFAPTDPQPAYKFIAISSGSECGVSLFPAGSDIINVSSYVTLPIFLFSVGQVKFEAVVKALPASGSPTNIAHLKINRTISLFFGAYQDEKILEEFNAFSPAGALPWDGAPGGTVDIAKRLGDNNSRNLTVPLGFAFIGANYTVQEKVCFVSVTSSLDITNVDAAALSASYVGGISPGNPSRAENFKSQEQFTNLNEPTRYNQDHRFFTAKNANWLFNEMQGTTPNDLNCSSQCQPSGFSINGPSSFCNTGDYIFETFPLNGAVTITWSATPSGIVTLTTNPDKSVTLTKIGNGNVTLTATIAGCNFTNNAISKTVHVGSFSSSDYLLDVNGSVNGYLPWCPNKTYGFSVSNLAPGASGSNYVWTIPQGWTQNYISNYLCVANAPTGTYPPTGTIEVSFTDGCGGTINKSMFVTYSSSACNTTNPCFIVSPNPAQYYVNVNVASSCMGSTYIRQIELVQASTGTSVYYQNYSYGNVTSTTINMYSYIAGTYYVRIYDGSSWSSYTIIH